MELDLYMFFFTFTWNESERSLSRPCFLMGGLGMVSLTAPLFVSGYPRSASDSLKNKVPKQRGQASCG